jgi:hypothetical protein
MSIFLEFFPENRRHLIGTLSGNSIIDEMSSGEFHQMVIECLTGRNPRIHTENWAQAKVFHGVFTGIQEMFTDGKKGDNNFIVDAPKLAAEYLYKHRKSARKSPDKLTDTDIILCQWICNLTSKGWDNILQANPENLKDWATAVLASIKEVAYGEEEQNIINMVIYNASLAKKGGLKSAMGNLFESLLLYSGLSACGLDFISSDDFDAADGPCFTLDVNEGRQADAQIKTGLTHPAKIDIDIGFIGKGNPEIIADKTQRFGNMVGGGQKPLDHTIIIVSSIPETDNAQLVVRQATLLGAKVITMSGNNWVHQLCESIQGVGVEGLSSIPEDVMETRNILKSDLQSSEEIIQSIPKNLDVPPHWGS